MSIQQKNYGYLNGMKAFKAKGIEQYASTEDMTIASDHPDATNEIDLSVVKALFHAERVKREQSKKQEIMKQDYYRGIVRDIKSAAKRGERKLKVAVKCMWSDEIIDWAISEVAKKTFDLLEEQEFKVLRAYEPNRNNVYKNPTDEIIYEISGWAE